MNIGQLNVAQSFILLTLYDINDSLSVDRIRDAVVVRSGSATLFEFDVLQEVTVLCDNGLLRKYSQMETDLYGLTDEGKDKAQGLVWCFQKICETIGSTPPDVSPQMNVRQEESSPDSSIQFFSDIYQSVEYKVLVAIWEEGEGEYYFPESLHNSLNSSDYTLELIAHSLEKLHKFGYLDKRCTNKFGVIIPCYTINKCGIELVEEVQD